jgi:hypothetical protein
MAPGHECRRAEGAWVGGICKTRRFEIISLMVPYGPKEKRLGLLIWCCSYRAVG